MTTRREFLAASAAAFVAAPPVNLGLLVYSYGLRAKAEKDTGFADPVRFLDFARSRGATAVQVPLGVRTDDSVRRTADKLGMHVEGIVSPPADDRSLDKFAAELAAAASNGVNVVRTVMLGGRRYETFDKAADYPAFADRATQMLRRAEPVARKHRVKLAVENHKDFRTDELVDLLKRVGSEFVGSCVDVGNNLALLDDPVATATALAPFALTVHLKDIGVEEAADGFRLTEVPLGRGVLDLKAIVAVIKAANPRARLHLEMITRDPLSIPVLTDKYWATLGRVPGQDLARTLTVVRKSAAKLPRVSGLPVADQLAAEDGNVSASFTFAAASGWFAD